MVMLIPLRFTMYILGKQKLIIDKLIIKEYSHFICVYVHILIMLYTFCKLIS